MFRFLLSVFFAIAAVLVPVHVIAAESDAIYTHASVSISSATSPIGISSATGYRRTVCFGELTGAASFYYKVDSTLTVRTDGWLVKSDTSGGISRECQETVRPIAFQLPAGVSSKTITYYTKEYR